MWHSTISEDSVRYPKIGLNRVERKTENLFFVKTGFTCLRLLKNTRSPDTIFTAHDATPVTFLQFINSYSTRTERACCILGSILISVWLVIGDEGMINGDKGLIDRKQYDKKFTQHAPEQIS